MKESDEKDLASHLGLDPYADHGNVVGVASARGTDRPSYRAPKSELPCADTVVSVEGNTRRCALASSVTARRSRRT